MKTEEKIHQLQEMEQSLQQFLMQKQAFQAQLMEAESAQEEIRKSDVVYKFAGNVLLRSDRQAVENDLKEKNETLLLRIRNIEKQEESFREKIKKLRTEILEEVKEKKGKK